MPVNFTCKIAFDTLRKWKKYWSKHVFSYNLFYHKISEITYSFEWNSLKSSWFGFDPKLCSQFRKKPFQNLLDTFIKDLSSSDFKSFWRWLVWLVSPRRFWFSFSEVSSQDKSEKIWYFDRNLKKQRGATMMNGCLKTFRFFTLQKWYVLCLMEWS